jgi:hypothetical protein
VRSFKTGRRRRRSAGPDSRLDYLEELGVGGPG